MIHAGLHLCMCSINMLLDFGVSLSYNHANLPRPNCYSLDLPQSSGNLTFDASVVGNLNKTC